MTRVYLDTVEVWGSSPHEPTTSYWSGPNNFRRCPFFHTWLCVAVCVAAWSSVGAIPAPPRLCGECRHRRASLLTWEYRASICGLTWPAIAMIVWSETCASRAPLPDCVVCRKRNVEPLSSGCVRQFWSSFGFSSDQHGPSHMRERRAEFDDHAIGELLLENIAATATTAALHTQLWLASVWGCRGRRPSTK